MLLIKTNHRHPKNPLFLNKTQRHESLQTS